MQMHIQPGKVSNYKAFTFFIKLKLKYIKQV